MIINGKEIQKELKCALAERAHALSVMSTLCVIQVGENSVTERFVRMKKRFGEEIGVNVEVTQLPEKSSLPEVLFAVAEKNNDPACMGIVVQLPLPDHIDVEAVCNAVDPKKDVDALHSDTAFRAPVALAVWEILQQGSVSIEGKQIVVVGEGKLVGKPVANFFRAQGVVPHVVTEDTTDPQQYFTHADIIVSGTGQPHMITPDMITDGVVLIDAGTSEQGGELKGDIDPACEQKAGVFTPVPGGVGPIVIAKLFENMLDAIEK